MSNRNYALRSPREKVAERRAPYDDSNKTSMYLFKLLDVRNRKNNNKKKTKKSISIPQKTLGLKCHL